MLHRLTVTIVTLSYHLVEYGSITKDPLTRPYITTSYFCSLFTNWLVICHEVIYADSKFISVKTDALAN